MIEFHFFACSYPDLPTPFDLIKEVKDLYSENYTTLKKLRKTQTNGSMDHAHGLEELTSSKRPYYPKQFIDSMQSLLEYP